MNKKDCKKKYYAEDCYDCDDMVTCLDINKPLQPSKEEKPSERIRKIWEEIKEKDRLNINAKTPNEINRYNFLLAKYNDIECLFGHESTLSKAVIFYLDEQYEK